MIFREILDHRGHTVSLIQTETVDPDLIHHVLYEDIEPMVKDAKHLAEQLKPGQDWYPVAHVPAAVAQKMMHDGSWDDDKHIRRWLNDHDNKCFRIWPGRV